MTPFEEMDRLIEWLCDQMGYKLYDSLPDKASYPFVFRGEMIWEDEHTKDVTLGEINNVIHVYHYAEDVNEATRMLTRINAALHQNGETDNYRWQVKKSKGMRAFDGTVSEGTCHLVLDITQKFESKHKL